MGADPLRVDNNGRTPLHVAILEGNIEAFEALLKVSDPSIPDIYGYDVMMYCDNEDVAGRIMQRMHELETKDKPADQNVTVIRGLYYTTEEFLKKLDAVRKLGWKSYQIEMLINSYMNAGGNINGKNSQGETALHIMAKGHTYGDSIIIAYLLERGANPRLQNNAEKRPSEIVRLNKYPKSSATIKKILESAEKNYDKKREEKFIELLNGLVEKKGIIMMEVEIDSYLRDGGNIHYINSQGDSLLHAICRSNIANQQQVIRHLLYCGANPLLPDKQGKTPRSIIAESSMDEELKTEILGTLERAEQRAVTKAAKLKGAEPVARNENTAKNPPTWVRSRKSSDELPDYRKIVKQIANGKLDDNGKVAALRSELKKISAKMNTCNDVMKRRLTEGENILQGELGRIEQRNAEVSSFRKSGGR